MVELDYLPPAEDVQDLVSVYYMFDVGDIAFQDRERAAIAQLRFILDGDAELGFVSGERSLYKSGAVLVGPATGAMDFHIKGPFKMFGMGLMPAGWHALVGVDATQYVDNAFPLSDFVAEDTDRYMEELRRCDNAEEMASWANRLFRQLKQQIKPEILEFTNRVDDWLSSEVSPSVSALMEQSPQSSRQVLRMVNKLYGMPPKFLARKYRALRAARALGSDDEDEIRQVEEAFYDQSHMIREIKLFTGTTPKRLQETKNLIPELIDQRRDLTGQIAPLVAQREEL